MMKKLLVVFGLILISCNKDNTNFSVEAPVTENAMFKNLDISKITNPIYLKGNIAFWISESNEFVVFAETAKLKHLFVLQSEKENFQNIEGKITSVLFLDHAFVLESEKGSKFYFGVSKPEEKAIYDQITQNKTVFDSVEYGIGVSHIWMGKEEDRHNITATNLKNAKSTVNFLGENCQHGGKGATSCSVTSSTGCSVSCGAGYYACCNSGVFSDSCKCKKNKPQLEEPIPQ